ncbi:MAG: hypothetical protein H6686_09740 [Fibrobacteria bacterium]|nr:hypothetical protein [Fibrobacteria bacterium]
MALPSFLEGNDLPEARNALDATAVNVLHALAESGILPGSELEYGYEDLPVVSDAALFLSEFALSWNREAGKPVDFRILQNVFLHAFRLGLDLSIQLDRRPGTGLRLSLDVEGVAEGSARFQVRDPLTEFAGTLDQGLADAFVSVKNRGLAVVASMKNEDFLHDYLACGYLWTILAGVEAGLTALHPPVLA